MVWKKQLLVATAVEGIKLDSGEYLQSSTGNHETQHGVELVTVDLCRTDTPCTLGRLAKSDCSGCSTLHNYRRHLEFHDFPSTSVPSESEGTVDERFEKLLEDVDLDENAIPGSVKAIIRMLPEQPASESTAKRILRKLHYEWEEKRLKDYVLVNGKDLETLGVLDPKHKSLTALHEDMLQKKEAGDRLEENKELYESVKERVRAEMEVQKQTTAQGPEQSVDPKEQTQQQLGKEFGQYIDALNCELVSQALKVAADQAVTKTAEAADAANGRNEKVKAANKVGKGAAEAANKVAKAAKDAAEAAKEAAKEAPLKDRMKKLTKAFAMLSVDARKKCLAALEKIEEKKRLEDYVLANRKDLETLDVLDPKHKSLTALLKDMLQKEEAGDRLEQNKKLYVRVNKEVKAALGSPNDRFAAKLYDTKFPMKDKSKEGFTYVTTIKSAGTKRAETIKTGRFKKKCVLEELVKSIGTFSFRTLSMLSSLNKQNIWNLRSKIAVGDARHSAVSNLEGRALVQPVESFAFEWSNKGVPKPIGVNCIDFADVTWRNIEAACKS